MTSGVIRSSAWADDANQVRAEIFWIDNDGRKFSARLTFGPEQALNFAEKLQSAALGSQCEESQCGPA